MDDVELVICWICNRDGPELGAGSGDTEPQVLKVGWRFEDGWVCPGCLDHGVS
jgi:hypothetical protein